MGALATPSLWSLLGFAGWTVLLVTVVLLQRTALVFAGKRRANAWPRGTTPEGEPAWIVRVRDAHLNCAEHLPVFAAVIAAAAASGQLAVTDPLAPYLLAARVGQSLVHLAGTGHAHVFVRANFFAVQLGLLLYMIASLL
jgi:uncharacterized MAPEG superfamily protein